MTLANLIIKVAPHITFRRLVATVLFYLACMHIVWPIVSISAGAFLRTDFDKAILESGRVSDDVKDIVDHFVEPNKRFEHIVERLWDLGFEREKILGTYIYRRRTVPPEHGPDDRHRNFNLRFNRMLENEDAEYIASLSRTIPGSLWTEYGVGVYILVRNDQSTVIKAKSWYRWRIEVPVL